MKLNEIVRDSFAEYKAADFVNASFLKAIKKSPLTAMKRNYTETAAMRFGSMYHKFILEHAEFAKEYEILDESERPDLTKGMTAKVNKEWKAEKETSGMILHTYDEAAQLIGMRKALNTFNPVGVRLMAACMKEVSLYTHLNIESHTLPIKGRFDCINIEQGYIVDLKTAADASPWGFSRDAGKFGYHIQAAFYMFLARAVFNKDFKMFFVAQEAAAPYNNAVYRVSDEMRIKGENELVQLLPAAMQLRADQKPRSYEIFCANDNGVFDLDVPDYHAQPREFNF